MNKPTLDDVLERLDGLKREHHPACGARAPGCVPDCLGAAEHNARLDALKTDLRALVEAERREGAVNAWTAHAFTAE